METALKFSLTPQVKKDEKTGLFSAWFVEFPSAVAIGEDDQDAKVKLSEAFKMLVEVRAEEVVEEILKQNREALTNFEPNLIPAWVWYDAHKTRKVYQEWVPLNVLKHTPEKPPINLNDIAGAFR